MAVDLADLVESLEREVSPPGTDLFPAAGEETWLGHLRDAFWHARLRGAFSGYTEDDGMVTPVDGDGDDLPREQQQLIVLTAGLRIIRSALRNTNTVFRAQAGPVEFETQQSAQTLKELLVQVDREFREALEAAMATADDATVAYFDAVVYRTAAIAEGTGWYVK